MKTFLALLFSVVVFSANTEANATSDRLPQTLPLIKTATDLGAENPETVMSIKVWLNFRQPELLDRLAQQVTDKNSPNFRHFLTVEQFQRMFAPSPKTISKVRNFLSQQGLKVEIESGSGHFVSATGKVGDVQKVFQVQLRNYLDRGKLVRANTTDPMIAQEIRPFVSMIGGLSNRAFAPRFIRKKDLVTGKAAAAIALSDLPSVGTAHYNCFRTASVTHTFTSADGLTQAVYSGGSYGVDPSDTTTASCSFDPVTLQGAYGLNALFKKNLDGRGQTIVIVDGFGSPTAQQDVDAFNQQYGLAPTSLTIYQPGGIPVTGAWNADQQDWAYETSLDLEYSHTIAPGADIALVEAITDSDSDLLAAVDYAVENHLGNIISNSWGDYESLVTQATTDQYEAVLKSAAVQGISVNVANGDNGDMAAQLGYSDVSFPASQYITSIGGTSLFLDSNNAIQHEIGWGNNQVTLTDTVADIADSQKDLNSPLSSPASQGFLYGSGGGASRSYPKPSYQKHLPGNTRQQPDISLLADPTTGVTIIESVFDDAGNPVVAPQAFPYTGGTSLSAPLFSGFWAIANQQAGYALGNAAPTLYWLPSSAIRDIVPFNNPSNVTGTITSPSGVSPESQDQLSVPATAAPFFSGFMDGNNNGYAWNVMTFGADSTLFTAKGWDNVTGLGVPNGKSFIDAIRY